MTMVNSIPRYCLWQAYSLQTALPTGHLSKIIRGNCLTLQVSNIAMQVGLTRGWQNNLKKKLANEIIHKEICKAPTYSWQSRRLYIHTGRAVHMPRIYPRRPQSDWLNLRLHKTRNWRLRQTSNLPASAWRMWPNTQWAYQQRLRELFIQVI